MKPEKTAVSPGICDRPRQFLAALLVAAGASLLPAADVGSVEQRLHALEETVARLQRENAALRRETGRDGLAKPAAPAPVQPTAPGIRLTGDIRGRFSSTMYQADEAATRDQFFFQVRVGFVAAVSETFDAGLRLSAGDLNANFGGTPLAAQFSAADNGSKKYVFFDQAFIRWKPTSAPGTKAAFTFGKSENLFYTPSRILFDSDYTPEGLTQEFFYQASARDRFWWAAGQYLIDDLTASARDPWMIAVRTRWEAQWTPAWSSTLGGGWLGLTHAEGLTAANVANNNRGNTRTAAGVPAYAYRPFYAEAGVTRLLNDAPGYTGKFPITLHADLLHNPGAPEANDAWSAGLTLGKAGKAGQWEIAYRHLRIGADAWYEEMLDADYGAFYRSVPPGWNNDAASRAGGHGGGTNIRSHSIRSSYSPEDYLLLSANLFINDFLRRMPGNATDTGTTRLQLEALVRF